MDKKLDKLEFIPDKFLEETDAQIEYYKSIVGDKINNDNYLGDTVHLMKESLNLLEEYRGMLKILSMLGSPNNSGWQGEDEYVKSELTRYNEKLIILRDLDLVFNYGWDKQLKPYYKCDIERALNVMNHIERTRKSTIQTNTILEEIRKWQRNAEREEYNNKKPEDKE